MTTIDSISLDGLLCSECQQPLLWGDGTPRKETYGGCETWEHCDCEGATAKHNARNDEFMRQSAVFEARRREQQLLPAVDGLETLRRQAAKERADAAKDTELADRERAVKERELLRREHRLDDYDAADADGPPVGDAGATLDDLAAVFDDEVDLTPTLAIMERGDGEMILPAGKLNWIYGYPGCGKSFFGEMELIEAVLRGGRTLYLDYEDNKKTFHQRAAMLGFTPKAHADSFKYVQGGVADFPIAFAQAVEWLAGAQDTEMNLVVIDAAESSGCPSDGAQVNDWLAKVVMPWRKLTVNAGVSVLDHIPKTKDNRPDGPIGSQRKMAAVDGISLLVGGYCWTGKKGGRLTLTNDKDRTGRYGKKEPVATIIGDWDGQGDSRAFGYRIVEPSKEDSANNNIGGAILNAGLIEREKQGNAWVYRVADY